jgi:hypothetical protein
MDKVFLQLKDAEANEHHKIIIGTCAQSSCSNVCI